ncbi:hypothetical protein DTW90_13140 [Neorhizobium sp. P12A]|jgi:hypothetical protein|uniref:hypothetical protein n=1 Tax=Neorhizobium sp. P12A TaxID=2268027 RepID=UPI0011EBBAB6|nr:hypothetical protein [Neorhizobium sp. P12A]KAA0698716.1 hypothetical protein DTW90_13140 [Neorhizobium sp. P12A]
MEIYSVRSSQNLHYKNSSEHAKTTKATDFSIDKPTGSLPVFKVADVGSGPDFTSITPSELRSHALQSYQAGVIDGDTYSELASPLPTHAIDAMGNVLDLSDVGENTSFNFVDYYQHQLDVAASIGDPQTAETMKSVVDYLKA